MSTSDYLFCSGDLGASIDGQRTKLQSAIEALKPNQLIDADEEQVCAHFIGEYAVQSLQLKTEELELIEPRELEVERKDRHFGGTFRHKTLEFRFEVPFEGDAMLFRLRPSQFTFNPPRASLESGKLVLILLREDRDGEAIKGEVNRLLDNVRQYIGWQKSQIDAWNQSLPTLVKQLVTARRDKLVADKQLVTGLGFRVRRAESSVSASVPIRRKAIIPPLPAPRSGPAAPPEPAIDAKVYEEILDTLAGMSLVLERNPSAFANIDEESLRTHFLVPLNSNFRGLASGETFNAAGKTDILIKHQDRILFIAECKFWKGAQSLTDAISQLLSYTTWRETKTAILLFNRNRDFSAVLAQIPTIFSQHSQFVRQENYQRPTAFRFVLLHPTDAQRHLTVTVLAFDVPSAT